MDDLCGLTLAAELGSAEAELVREIAAECEANGQPEVTAKTFQAQAQVNLALSEGRIDAAVSSASQVAYVLSQTGDKFKLVELPWAPGYDTGLALARNENTEELAKAVQAATDHLIENGKLQEILDEFNDGQGGIEQSEIVPTDAG
jgi:polar amino acid transport system substrate-binding protein